VKEVSRKKAQKAQKEMKMRSVRQIFELCDQVREASYALHHYLRHGHLEKVYENGLANRLRKAVSPSPIGLIFGVQVVP